MPFKEGDWVRTDKNEIVKVASIDRRCGTATVQTLDEERLRIVSVSYPIEQLVRLETER